MKTKITNNGMTFSGQGTPQSQMPGMISDMYADPEYHPEDYVEVNIGQGNLPWAQGVWDYLNKAVYQEANRIKIAQKVLPHQHLPSALTATSDRIIPYEEARKFNPTEKALTIDEAAIVPLCETWVEFKLTPQQLQREEELMTARTLAIRATNILSQAQDLLIFNGGFGLNDPLFGENKRNGLVSFKSGPAGKGLLRLNMENGKSTLRPDQIVTIDSLEDSEERFGNRSFDRARFGERTFEAVAEGYARLQDKGHYGPYALVLHTIPFADTFAPLPNTLIMPADRIRPLVSRGFYGSGTLPENTGVLVSLGGNSMDIVVGKPPVLSFQTQDPEGNFRFRVTERFALRLKDESAVIKLEFRVNSAAEEAGS